MSVEFLCRWYVNGEFEFRAGRSPFSRGEGNMQAAVRLT